MDLDLGRRLHFHASRYNWPDALIAFSDGRYALIVHDGVNSSIDINICPWCGTRLNGSITGEIDADIAEDSNLGSRGHRSLVRESGGRIRGR